MLRSFGAGIFGRPLGAGTGACLGAMFVSHGLSGLEGVTTPMLALPGGPGILGAGLCIAPGFLIIGVGGCAGLGGSGSNVTSSGLPFAVTPKSASSKRSLPNSPSPSNVLVSLGFSSLPISIGRGGRSSSSWGEGLGGGASFLAGA